MPMLVKPVTLAGNVVRLEPLGQEHAPICIRVSQDPDIWTYMPVDPSHSLEALSTWIEAALRARAQGQQMPFAIVDALSGRVYRLHPLFEHLPQDYGLEIGWTWLAREVRRTAVNTECKYLLLRHAFESLGAIRVQLKTDSRNQRSQRAIERLGAVREGVLRKQMILENGYQRDTVMYSIIADEWPAVKSEPGGEAAGLSSRAVRPSPIGRDRYGDQAPFTAAIAAPSSAGLQRGGGGARNPPDLPGPRRNQGAPERATDHGDWSPAARLLPSVPPGAVERRVA